VGTPEPEAVAEVKIENAVIHHLARQRIRAAGTHGPA
jgi:hypothetical protein